MIRAFHSLLSPLTARLSLALRVAILTTAAVALTMAAISAIVYFSVRSELQNSLDRSILSRAEEAVDAGVDQSQINSYADAFKLAGIRIELIRGGVIFSSPDQITRIPDVTPLEISVSLGEKSHSTRTGTIDDKPYRIVAVHSGPGTALVLAQSMESASRTLDRLTLLLWVISAIGVASAGLSGWVVATNGLRPVRRLTDATERVARTEELTPIKVTGDDELARLTASFNHMLVALDASQERQRQLVADAGHELRTPLTSLRTNIELLGQASGPHGTLSPDQRREIMDDVQAQLEELTTLVGDLVELARDEPMRRDPEPFDLAETVQLASDRVRRRAADVNVETTLAPWLIIGEPGLLERAVTNLLDNAVKWSPIGATVTVHLTDGVLTVSDQGPGISADDLPYVFDRFYRATDARTLPGSGLGLAIVRRAAERHGGQVTAASTTGAGSTFTMRVPGQHTEPDSNAD